MSKMPIVHAGDTGVARGETKSPPRNAPPVVGWDRSLGRFECRGRPGRRSGGRCLFKRPSGDNRRVDHECHQYLAFVAPAQNLIDRNLAGVLARLLDIGKRPIDLLLSAMRFRYDPRGRPAVVRDNYRLAPFDIVEQPGRWVLASAA